MFDLVFDAFAAFEQVGFFMAALFCLGIGGLMLSNALYWRIKARRVTAEIIGIRKKKNVYYTVYSYMHPDTGETIEAMSDGGSSILKGRETGRRVELMMFPDNPGNVRNARGYVLLILGLILIAIGLGLGSAGWRVSDITPMTFIMAFVFMLFIGVKIKSGLLPREKWKTVTEWREQRRAEKQKEWKDIPMQQYEDIYESSQNKKMSVEQKKTARWMAPILLLVSFGLFYGSYYLGDQLAQLEAEGLRTSGVVVSFEESYDSESGTTYYPVVEYQTRQNRKIKFKDNVGSSHPSLSRGDDVEVLYLADDPKGSAIIDRGAWNWLPALLVGGFGCILFLVSLSLFKGLRQTEVR